MSRDRCPICETKLKVEYSGCSGQVWDECPFCGWNDKAGGSDPESLLKYALKDKNDLIKGIMAAQKVIDDCVSFLDQAGLYEGETKVVKMLANKYKGIKKGEA